MGERLVHPVIAYLDTNVVVWLAGGNLNRISKKSPERSGGGKSADLSDGVPIELEYLKEVNRIKLQRERCNYSRSMK